MNQFRRLHSLSHRIIVYCCLCTFLCGVVFSGFNVAWLYCLENTYLNRMIDVEVDYVDPLSMEQIQRIAAQKEHLQLINDQQLPEHFDIGQCEEHGHRAITYHHDGQDFIAHGLAQHPGVWLVTNISKLELVRPYQGMILLTLSAVALGLILLTCLIIYLVLKKLLRPLNRLADFVATMKIDDLPKGFAARYPANEVGLLAFTLEEKITRISEFIYREQNFTRDVSHELRTAIAIIKNQTSELMANPNIDQQQRQKLEHIQHANFEAENTVKNLLFLAREQHDELVHHSVKLLPVVESTIIQQAYLLDGKNVNVDVNIDAAVSVHIPAGVLAILLSNLISNAFQYTQQGQVEIGFDNYKLSVSDTGIGIPQSIRHKVEQPFVKSENSRGYGVGMAIVNRLCDVYHLRFYIEDKQPGTCVTVVFPTRA
ncbi:sensor histidine kinase [Neptunicella marina]|uniref:histidine kinase n=1 Tax=Neptunicella marina TaxID=2125989 RepID=A0A8J6IVR8_9ALTE|nr:HAMP domain-containing sensor histidine kinase [Neptunicella marina]MBC3767566.1 HAMP domain-containing histidine kinase [Neptunicella marina]